MDIYAEQGTKVKYIGTSDHQVNWGSCDDPREVLVEGQEYTVDHTEVHSWHTKVYLQEYPTLKFNSACLE